MTILRWVLYRVSGRTPPWDEPTDQPIARQHEPIIHEARNARALIQGNTVLAERRAARVKEESAEVLAAAHRGDLWDPISERFRGVARMGGDQ